MKKTIPANVSREIAERLQNEPKVKKNKGTQMFIYWVLGISVVIVTLSACGLIPKD